MDTDFYTVMLLINFSGISDRTVQYPTWILCLQWLTELWKIAGCYLNCSVPQLHQESYGQANSSQPNKKLNDRTTTKYIAKSQ
jgi:hypothetical protein